MSENLHPPTPAEVMAQSPASPPVQAAVNPVTQQPIPEVRKDEDGVIFVIGKKDIKVPPLNFYVLKKVWEEMTNAMSQADSIKRIDHVINVVVAAMNERPDRPKDEEDFTNEYFSRKLLAQEWPLLTTCYTELLRLSGLLPPEGQEFPAMGEAQGGAGSGEASDSSKLSSGIEERAVGQLEETATGAKGNGTLVNGPTSMQ
jgi:hypothetical protein